MNSSALPPEVPLSQESDLFPLFHSYKTPAKPDGVNYIQTEDEVS